MNEIKERRTRLGVSQIELAQKVGVSPMTIQLWERGVTIPKIENEMRLNKILSELEEEQVNKIKARNDKKE